MISAHQPRLSIGMPVYNGERYLKEAIDSILSQSFEDFELIISDNASTDGTAAICEEYLAQDQRIRYSRNSNNLGAARNYNQVFSLASGEYFKWASHDDLLVEGFLEKCVKVLDEDPSVILCHAKTGIIDEDGEFIGEYNSSMRADQPVPSERFMDLVLIPHPCTAVFGVARREALKKTPLIGPYVGSDRNLLAELGLMGRIYEIPEELFYRRDHPDASISKYEIRNRLGWFDPQKEKHIHLPYIRRGLEYARSVLRVPLGWTERVECFRIIAFWLLKRERQNLATDFRMAGQSVVTKMPGVTRSGKG